MTNEEQLQLIKYSILSKLLVLNEQQAEYAKINPASIKYTGVTAQIEILEELRELLER